MQYIVIIKTLPPTRRVSLYIVTTGYNGGSYLQFGMECFIDSLIVCGNHFVLDELVHYTSIRT